MAGSITHGCLNFCVLSKVLFSVSLEELCFDNVMET